MVVAAAWFLFSPSQQSQWTKRLPALAAAVQRYSHDGIWRGRTLPPTVSLQELADGGYISQGEARDLSGANITFYPVSNQNDPNAILVRVQLSDGSQIVAVADGSIQSHSSATAP